MEFQMDLTLRQLASTATAASFWKRDDIQTMMKQYLYPHCRRGTKESLAKLIQECMKKMDPASSPRVLSNEVLLAIKDIGYKIINWFFYLRRKKAFRNISRAELYDTFFQDIYFTHYGSIDELKILRYSWMNIPNVELWRLYIMACYSCSEGLINELWERMVANGYQFYSYVELYRRLGFHLVAYWNKLRENALQSFHDDCIVPNSQGEWMEIYDPNASVEVNMFRLSVRKGYVRALKFFGNKMNQEEKERNVEFCLTTAIDTYYIKHDWEFYRREQCIEICLYLCNFLTKEKIKTVFEDKKMSDLPPYIQFGNFIYFDVFSTMFISMWPWQECFKPVLNLVKDVIHEEQYGTLMSNLIKETIVNFKLGEPVETSIFQRQLQQVWRTIPHPGWKASIGRNLDIKTLFGCDMSTAQLILNDKRMATEREELIKKFRDEYFYIIKQGNEKNILRDFIKKILILSEWDEEVREMVGCIYTYVMNGDLDSISKLTESSSQQEIIDFKLKIDHELMCYYLITKNKFELADEFLRWKFDKTEDIVNFKKSFLDKKFTADHIRHLWSVSKENVESVKTNANTFLLWFLEEETDVNAFKSEQIASKMFNDAEVHCWKFVNRHNFEMLQQFLRWCNLNENQLKLIREYIVITELKSFLRECMSRNSIDEAEKALKFAFDSENERHDFMRKILTARPRSITLKSRFYYIVKCKLYIGKYSHFDLFSPKPTREELTENFTKLINYFIKPYVENFDELRSALRLWPEVSRRHVEEIGEDSVSSHDEYSDDPDYHYSDEFFEHLMYCERESYDLFLSLLDSIENVTE